jgi:hypothetical protein
MQVILTGTQFSMLSAPMMGRNGLCLPVFKDYKEPKVLLAHKELQEHRVQLVAKELKVQ